MKSKTEELVSEGIKLLKEKKFPGILIESIRKKSTRKEVTRRIYASLSDFNDLTPKEKNWRNQFFQVQNSFHDYILAYDKVVLGILILFFLGFITFVTAFIKLNYNLEYGIISMIEAVLLLIIVRNQLWLNNLSRPIVFILPLLFIAEFILMGLPESYMEFIYRSPYFETAMNGQFSDEGGIIIVLNESTPYLYVLIKVVPWFLFIWYYFKRKKFLSEMTRLEEVEL